MLKASHWLWFRHVTHDEEFRRDLRTRGTAANEADYLSQPELSIPQ
jgi:hypothetical protein